METTRIREVLTRVEQCSDALPVVVFDLDSTLFGTGSRNLRILNEFVQLHGAEWPGLRQRVAELTPQDMGWEIWSSLPDADARLQEGLVSFWKTRFFTDAYCREDEPSDGAVAFANAVFERGALVYYLTGRHVGGMEQGTAAALVQCGFPLLGGRAILHLKPEFRLSDKAFKDEAITRIRELKGRVVATFENEPGNANLFSRSFPEALHFLIESVHSPNAEAPLDSLIRIADFSGY